MIILQADTHRSKNADLLMEQMVLEKGVQAVLISEQYPQSEKAWIEDESGTAVIRLPRGTNFVITPKGSGDGVVYVQNSQFTMTSCYLTPNDNIDERRLIIAGDLNSKATEWGSATTNSRDKRVLDMAARLGLVVLNTGTTTYRKPGCEGTTPDIPLASESTVTFTKDCRVLEDYNGSDHQYITLCIEMETQRVRENRNKSTRKWNINKLNPATLLATIDENKTTIYTNSTAKTLVKATMQCITIGCNASMPKIDKNKKRNAVH
ncbi:uncharacterized protein LOC128861993 [Anastrepha ludens]|uniref:uncharacterized protein LOC128861993 n=1 Tax=Anastrepha ludens TaxID=28586 RepID=UPI0023B052B7|nr:uncharacterized protein LOC128861993 [Anastrepha ludens]